MSWLSPVVRFGLLAAVAVALAGCFQPMYADTPLFGSGPSLRDAMRDVEVAPIEGRVGQEIRNDIIFELNGGSSPPAGAPYKLEMRVAAGAQHPIVDPTTGLAQVDIVTLDVNYRLVDIANNRAIFVEKAIARVTVDRTKQRFARLRAVRDAETRAAKVVAEQIRSRVASYFLTKT